MSRTGGMWTAAVLSVLMTTASLVVTSDQWMKPSTWAPLFWKVAFLLGPFALYLGYCLRMYLEIASPLRTIRLHAHAASLGFGAAILVVVVTVYAAIWGTPERLLWEFLPRTLSATVMGCTGLAWGALWSLDGPDCHKACSEKSNWRR